MAVNERSQWVQEQRQRKHYGWPNCRKPQMKSSQNHTFNSIWEHWKIAVSFHHASMCNDWSIKHFYRLFSIGSSEEGLETCGTNKSPTSPPTTTTAGVRSNNAIATVCWHRGATVGLRDFIISSENQLSGYLLRKFKNSSGWQKLWVVFTSFCLFFYKNYQDEFALASLPLLG